MELCEKYLSKLNKRPLYIIYNNSDKSIHLPNGFKQSILRPYNSMIVASHEFICMNYLDSMLGLDVSYYKFQGE